MARILLAEDSPNDVELTLAALAEHHIANQVDVVRDGAEALDYLHARGAYSGRRSGNPVVLLLDLKMPKVTGLQVLEEIKSDPVVIEAYLGVDEEPLDETKLQTGTVDLSLLAEPARETRDTRKTRETRGRKD